MEVIRLREITLYLGSFFFGEIQVDVQQLRMEDLTTTSFATVLLQTVTMEHKDF
jgi:hypothetical protein